LHELNAALYADKVVVLVGGRITCSGAVSDEKTRAAITDAFSNRIEIRQLDGHWVALPRL
jgi:iron complex transport system ATP-binding protein